MAREKIAITLDERSIGELDRLVDQHVYQTRSQAIQEAVSEKLHRMKRTKYFSLIIAELLLEITINRL